MNRVVQFLARRRKAIAAAATPILALPLAGWISGDVEFSESALAGGALGAVAGVVTYYFPNATAE